MTDNETPEESDTPTLDKLALNSIYGKHVKIQRTITSMTGLVFTKEEAAILINAINIRTDDVKHNKLRESLAINAYPDISIIPNSRIDLEPSERKPFTMEDLYGPPFEDQYGTVCNECGCEAPAFRTHIAWHNKIADL